MGDLTNEEPEQDARTDGPSAPEEPEPAPEPVDVVAAGGTEIGALEEQSQGGRPGEPAPSPASGATSIPAATEPSPTDPEPGDSPATATEIDPVPRSEVAPAEEAPVVPAEEAPVAPAEEAPVVPAEEAPVAAAEEAPVAEERPERRVTEVVRPSGRLGQLRRYWPVGLLALSTVALIAGIAIALSNTGTPAPKPEPNRAAKPELVTVRDDQAGFSIAHPKEWRAIPIPPGIEDLRLVISAGGEPDGADGVWVRVVPPAGIDQKINQFANEIQQLTGGIPCGTQGSACLRQEQVNVDGMNAVRYVYLTKEQGTDQESVHLQYFVRRGEGNLYILVFQALPRAELGRLAPAFDEVLTSFRTLDPVLGPVTTTSSPPTTAAR